MHLLWVVFYQPRALSRTRSAAHRWPPNLSHLLLARLLGCFRSLFRLSKRSYRGEHSNHSDAHLLGDPIAKVPSSASLVTPCAGVQRPTNAPRLWRIPTQIQWLSNATVLRTVGRGRRRRGRATKVIILVKGRVSCVLLAPMVLRRPFNAALLSPAFGPIYRTSHHLLPVSYPALATVLKFTSTRM